MASKIIELNDDNICKLCENALAKYSCPKCELNYCSLDCYQSDVHLKCSEEFYKDSVLGELSLTEAPPRSKMMEMLRKVHEENPSFGDQDSDSLDSDDAEEVEDIADRLRGVDLDDTELVWEKLTEDERQEFASFLNSEDVTKLIPPWTPWWDYYDERKVQAVDGEPEYKTNCPRVSDVPEFSKLSTKQPAYSVRYDLINVLGGYAFAVRYFNGEHAEYAKEASACVSEISLSLTSSQNFNDRDFALKSLEQRIINSDWIQMDTENLINMKEDVRKILRGPSSIEPKYYVLSALSDLSDLLRESTKDKKAFCFARDQFPSVKLMAPKEVKNCIRRVEFFLSYAKHVFT